jgi:hypothetical protein
MKRDFQRANKTNDGAIEGDDDLFEDKPKTQKALEKMIKSREGNNAYESDEDKNPYASSVCHMMPLRCRHRQLTIKTGGGGGGGARACSHGPRYPATASTDRSQGSATKVYTQQTSHVWLKSDLTSGIESRRPLPLGSKSHEPKNEQTQPSRSVKR